jgi:hypothetical protein
MNDIWERVLANSFSGIHKSKIICSVRVGGSVMMFPKTRTLDSHLGHYPSKGEGRHWAVSCRDPTRRGGLY